LISSEVSNFSASRGSANHPKPRVHRGEALKPLQIEEIAGQDFDGVMELCSELLEGEHGFRDAELRRRLRRLSQFPVARQGNLFLLIAGVSTLRAGSSIGYLKSIK
jgi:hypothetical protein